MNRACAILFLTTLTVPLHSTILYTVSELGTLGGSTHAMGLNASGHVVGYSYLAGDSNFHAFFFSDGALTDLGTFGYDNIAAYGINDTDQITGSVAPASGGTRAFVYSNGAMVEIPLLGALAEGRAINSAGQVVGAGYGNHAFLYDNGSVVDLGDLGGLGHSVAFDINDYANVTGTSTSTAFPSNGVAFMYDHGALLNLGTLGAVNAYGFGINNNNVVVGESGTLSGQIHPFLYAGSGMVDLGTVAPDRSSGAYGINDAGDIVGWGVTLGNVRHAFIYKNGVMTDLNGITDAAPNITLQEGRAINNNGQIIANGTLDGHERAFLLTPVAPAVEAPEPATLVLTAAAFVAAALSRRTLSRLYPIDKSQ